MKPFVNQAVEAVFAGYPAAVRRKLMMLRETIFEVAAGTPGVGPIDETLRWGEPAYLTTATRSGSSIRIAWKPAKPNQYAMYFICTTDLVSTFRSLFPHDFRFEGRRALVFEADDAVPMDALAVCIRAALTYHQKR